ncbi:PAAR domain-containing protein [Saccharopolyspora phatthalungensis]|uniref:Putative Zn-binding protein involved in type VI secretion n=1 Tax=Saccharopolyspora phatthalungensis TaxID=664693 RepID=A0A840Q3E8_9PSEU|nr:PAAR domain-containing protein [Saccharopolyspora phatthalungensis]MBB5157042.1 putative Zn-binding protein involved in type VI secretion [Saccharopolyspora phatthalungensis]
MGKPAAKLGDRVTGTDTHLVQPPGPVQPSPVPLPFNGTLLGQLSRTVRIESRPAATVGSTATNLPPHIPPVGTFVKPPTNEGRVMLGSLTVRINGKPAARAGDPVLTCNDPVDLPVGRVQAEGTVRIGG